LRAIGTYLEVAEHRYEGNQMPRLCESTGYPLDRRAFQTPFAGDLSVRTALAEPPALNVSVQRRKPGSGRQRVRLPVGASANQVRERQIESRTDGTKRGAGCEPCGKSSGDGDE
jgi:hypothetical protein